MRPSPTARRQSGDDLEQVWLLPCISIPEQPMYYLGIDVHKDELHVAVLDEDDEIDREIRVENANLDEVVQQYEGSQAAIEATATTTRSTIPSTSIWASSLPIPSGPRQSVSPR